VSLKNRAMRNPFRASCQAVAAALILLLGIQRGECSLSPRAQRVGTKLVPLAKPPVLPEIVPKVLATAEEETPPGWTNILATMTVPLIWGTYSPLIKLVYSGADDVISPPPILFNFLSYLVSFFCLNAAQKLFFFRKKDDAATTTTTTSLEEGSYLTRFATPLESRAGFELGMWLFFGSTVQIMGIQSTTATRAAILVQLTTIIVPILDSLFSAARGEGRDIIPPRLWLSCVLALVGVCLVTLEGQSGAPFSPELLSSLFSMPRSGDLLVLLSALFYSTHVVRLGQVVKSKEVSPVRLARVKSLTELTASATVLLLFFLLDPPRWKEVQDFLAAARAGGSDVETVALSVLWNGAAATALTNSLQTYGQRTVSPTTANLLYTTQPIWAALFSFLLLRDQPSVSAVFGIAVLALAVSLSSSPDDYSPSDQQQKEKEKKGSKAGG